MEDCSLLSVHRSLLARFSVVQYSAEWTYHMLRFPVVWQYKQCCNENLYLCCLAHVPAYLQDVFLEVEWLGQVVCAFETVGDVGKLFPWKSFIQNHSNVLHRVLSLTVSLKRLNPPV